MSADKRGTWSKADRDEIWEDYADRLVDRCYGEEIIRDNPELVDWKIKLPCPWCGEEMLKAKYRGAQDVDDSWDIDHMDADPENNDLHNLQPMHSECNREKGNTNFKKEFPNYNIKIHECEF